MLQQVKMPHVRFETHVRETKDAEGHNVFTNVIFAHIMPVGGKDEVIKVADEWMKELREKAMNRGPFDSAASEYEQWYARFSQMLKNYKDGEETPANGTPIKACLAFTKAEVAQAEAARVFTIEDLADVNEEGIARMGMGGRNLKTKAQKILEDKKSGDLASENEALRIQLEELRGQVEELRAAIPVEKRGPGRPPKT